MCIRRYIRIPKEELEEAESIWRSQFEEVELDGDDASSEEKAPKKKRIVIENVIGGDIFSIWHKVQTLIQMSVLGSLKSTFPIEEMRTSLNKQLLTSNTPRRGKGALSAASANQNNAVNAVKQQLRLVRVVEYGASGQKDDEKITESSEEISKSSDSGEDAMEELDKEEDKEHSADVGFIGLCLPRSLDISIVVQLLAK
jgi:hypothetical protein